MRCTLKVLPDATSRQMCICITSRFSRRKRPEVSAWEMGCFVLPLPRLLLFVVGPGRHLVQGHREIPVHPAAVGIGEAIYVLFFAAFGIKGLHKLVLLFLNELVYFFIVARATTPHCHEAQALQRFFGLGRLVGLRLVLRPVGRCAAALPVFSPVTSETLTPGDRAVKEPLIPGTDEAVRSALRSAFVQTAARTHLLRLRNASSTPER